MHFVQKEKIVNKKFLLLSASAALVFAACGDENTTNVTEMAGPKTLAKGETLKDYECSKDNIGEFVFVTDSANVYYCDGEDWQNLKGEKGDDGLNCSAKKNSDGDYELTCDGEKVGTIKNGENGEPGDNGTSCTTKKNSDGDYELTCDGKKVGTIKNGENGKDGANCTAKKNSKGDYDLTCDGKSVGTIKNGESATQGGDCKVLEEGSAVTITCGEGDGATSVTLYKATCGGVPYDPEVDVCREGGESIKLSCGVDVDEVKNVLYTSAFYEKRYDEKFYDPLTSFCHEGVIADFCGGKTYDPTKQYCQNGNIIDAKCNGTTYNPLEKYCKDGEIAENPTCDGESYFPETQYCNQDYKDVYDYGYVVDEGVTYKTVDIYAQTWFAENMNKKTDGSKCVDGDENEDGSCKTYGRLYTYEDAKDVCPEGWNLPSKQDVEYSIIFIRYDFENVGDALKSTMGWGGYGTDAYGFAALAAGYYSSNESKYVGFGSEADFWTSDNGYTNNTHYVFYLNNKADETERNEVKFSDGPDASYFSVRCKRDLYLL